MAHCNAEVIADSFNELTQSRLTTFRLTMPRIILAEFNTHRMLSRNAASSRAIPVERMISQVMNDPFIPIFWGKNQPGMVSITEIDEEMRPRAEEVWLRARGLMVECARELMALGVAKQTSNRLLEPWMMTTVIASATSWNNFFTLRCHPHAQPEFRDLAERMRAELYHSTPVVRNWRTAIDNHDAWHLPFIDDAERQTRSLSQIQCASVARCARVSYHRSGESKSSEDDSALYRKLSENGHYSPFEHLGLASFTLTSGNFRGWEQYRIEKFGYTP